MDRQNPEAAEVVEQKLIEAFREFNKITQEGIGRTVQERQNPEAADVVEQGLINALREFNKLTQEGIVTQVEEGNSHATLGAPS